MKVLVSIRGRDGEGNYLLSTIKVEVPRDWSGLEAAFAEKRTIGGTVLEVVKGGLRVDVGVRAFMPASRSGAKDQAELEKLVGQQIECRITKVDSAAEDVVVDRRVILEEREREVKRETFERLTEGSIVHGTVRSLTDFGAFLDLGGIDGLLHVTDMAYARNVKPSDVVKQGDELDVKILKINRETRKIALGLKQLSPDPWSLVPEKYPQGSRVKGKVSRVTDFGAFVELEPGLDGLIHLSEMSWSKKVRKPADLLKPADTVEVVVLSVSPSEKRISLGLKQAMGDPWDEVEKNFPVGAVVEGPVTQLKQFGAFVQVTENVEGMIHVGDIVNEKRINHPQDELKVGQVVRAMVLENDREKRRLRLGLKQLVPTALDEYISEHKQGDDVTGRVVEINRGRATIELGEGVHAMCALAAEKEQKQDQKSGPVDVSTLSSMLTSKWKGKGAAGAPAAESAPRDEGLKAGQIRTFRIAKLDAEKKKIELEPA
jgi:small subunit ribosomal protein S1